MLETKFTRIAYIAKAKPKERFTSLVHMIDEELLKQCHQELNGKKSVGVDGITKEEYQRDLEENIKMLHEKLRKMSYKPREVKRVYIPKAGSHKTRALGIPTHEDKIVQLAVSKILSAIYEQDFLEFSFGFRPNKNCHGALRELNSILITKKINWVVDVDIRGFFDNVNHQWMKKALEVRISDKHLIRLIMRMLKSGIMEQGIRQNTLVGTPQGGVISPLLANIYLHYILDLWFEKKIKKHNRGETEMVRYADDFACCFQYENEAKRFYQQLQERLSKFGLKIAENKTSIIEFGRYAYANRKKQGLGKPATFNFLGFTHYCGRSRAGKFRVKRKTENRKYWGALARVKDWLKQNRHLPIHDIWKGVRIRLLGHYHYYGITDNSPMLSKFHYWVTWLMFKWVNRRSQRNSYTWENFKMFLKINPLPAPKVYVSIIQ